MTLVDSIRRALQAFDFKRLFLEELGWDKLNESPIHIKVEGQPFMLAPVAQKRGVRVLRCLPAADGRIPARPTCTKISQEVTKRSAEHLLVFVDAAEQEQLWLWGRRVRGQARPPVFSWRKGQSGAELASRLAVLEVSFAEEPTLLQPHVAGKLKGAFDVEKVTKKFYDLFKKRHEEFAATIGGIPDAADREWYASLMLNRLMFVYFIQRKGFLNDDVDYLRSRLTYITSQYPSGESSFYAYYRVFLLRLFHEGFGRRERSSELISLIGKVPYLNGGIFDIHQLEQIYDGIAIDDSVFRQIFELAHNLEQIYTGIIIPDESFRQIFDFFDGYQWQLDDRPTREGNEINPDVLGYIFEKYINNKQMGAYYTKEDITEYIGKNTIIPFVFERAAREHPAGFADDGPVWALLRENPDRYLYPAVRYGVDLPLPAEIDAGLDDPAHRADWNKPAPAEYGLPTEIWREHVTRRRRCEELRAKLAAGEVVTVNELITHNLDIRQFAADAIQYCADPRTLHALFGALRTVSVLDPTCGSGAFLFAALNILEPLYAASLDCMLRFVEDLRRAADIPADALGDFQATLAEANDRRRHPSRPYFILKSIILNNLYGVDIMEEAVEICKLRLFLKLVAQAESAGQIEPLPDIDFNIRAGNTLVGYATQAEVERMLDEKMDVFAAKDAITASAKAAGAAYSVFRESQARYDADPTAVAADKARLRSQLGELNDRLNRYLAQEYGVSLDKAGQFEQWLASHKPFHWFVEFYDIVTGRDGFDVIIGNPPYLGYPKVRSQYTIRGYRTENCSNLYAFTIERSLNIIREQGYLGMIVPIASISTVAMTELQSFYQAFPTWHSNFAVRPGKLFVGVDMNLTITLLQYSVQRNIAHTTSYYRWFDSEPSNRSVLFENLYYARKPKIHQSGNPFPKLGPTPEYPLLQKMVNHGAKLSRYTVSTGVTNYYHSGGRYWRKALPSKLSSHYKPVTVAPQYAPIVGAMLNSQLFYWYWISNSNCMDVVSREVLELPVFRFEQVDISVFAQLYEKLIDSYFSNNITRHRRGELINGDEINIKVGKSKPIIDEIDRVLAQHYGFTDEELDFIINYDIKYRMGKDSDDSE